MEKILDYYLRKNEDPEWVTKYSSLAKENDGKIFEYVNTNFRKLDSFENAFIEFSKNDGKKRGDWENSGHGQEKDKHYTVKMTESKLFIRTKDTYYKSSKGLVFESLINEQKEENQEKWYLRYLLLLDGTYGKENNHILEITKDFFEKMNSLLGVDKINDIIVNFKETLKNNGELYDTDFFIVHSLHTDYNFLEMYEKATPEERSELKNKIKHNIKHSNDCAISKKYRLSGNYTRKMLKDDFQTLLITKSIIDDIPNTDFDKFIESPIHLLNEISNEEIEKDTILKFIKENKAIFESVFNSILGVDIEEEKEIDINIVDTINISEEELLENVNEESIEKIDDTSIEGKRKIKLEFSKLRVLARKESYYKCELEKLNNCKYFTSKATNQNYIEIHHLIPQEFRNYFDYSIESLANYITLCPHCHRQIHLAVDREREVLITYLYNLRIERLTNVGLELKLEDLLKYNKISDQLD